jgi:hypothetical protein
MIPIPVSSFICGESGDGKAVPDGTLTSVYVTAIIT